MKKHTLKILWFKVWCKLKHLNILEGECLCYVITFAEVNQFTYYKKFLVFRPDFANFFFSMPGQIKLSEPNKMSKSKRTTTFDSLLSCKRPEYPSPESPSQNLIWSQNQAKKACRLSWFKHVCGYCSYTVKIKPLTMINGGAIIE